VATLQTLANLSDVYTQVLAKGEGAGICNNYNYNKCSFKAASATLAAKETIKSMMNQLKPNVNVTNIG